MEATDNNEPEIDESYHDRVRSILENDGLHALDNALETVKFADMEIAGLKEQINHLKSQEGMMAQLTAAGYCTGALWHIDDVKKYAPALTDAQAMEILNNNVGDNADHSTDQEILDTATRIYCEDYGIEYTGEQEEEEEETADFDSWTTQELFDMLREENLIPETLNVLDADRSDLLKIARENFSESDDKDVFEIGDSVEVPAPDSTLGDSHPTAFVGEVYKEKDGAGLVWVQYPNSEIVYPIESHRLNHVR